LDNGLRRDRIKYINIRWEQLYHLDKEWSERALKLLFVTNAGGAIAVLSYMASVEGRAPKSAIITLCCFFFGLICVGINTARAVHGMSGLFEGWQKDVDRFFKDEITWEELQSRDESRISGKWLDYLIGYFSWGAFIIGSIIGFVGFLYGKH